MISMAIQGKSSICQKRAYTGSYLWIIVTVCLPSTISKISALLSLYVVTVTLQVKVMISISSKFLSKHSIKYDIVTVTFKVIQEKSSWC